MPKDSTAPSQNWSIKDQIEQSKKINQENEKNLNDYKAKTEAIKSIQSTLDEYENNGYDVSSYRKKLDEKLGQHELSFGEKLGVIGRNIGDDYVRGGAKVLFGAKPVETYSQKMDDLKQTREEVINPISTIASEVVMDPLTYAPLNFASKGTKAVRMAKDFGKGGALSSGTYTLKEAGDDNYKPTDSLIAGLFGGALNAGIGRFLNRKISGDLPNSDVTSADDITNKFLYEQKKVNPEVVTKPVEPTADELVQDNIIKPNNQDDIAKRINEANFKNDTENDIKLNTTINQTNYLPETLPINNKEAMVELIKYAKNNNAVDEFISKLPPNAKVDKVQKLFDNLSNHQPKTQNINNGILTSNGTQSFGGASVGGLESEFNQRDYDNNGEHNYKDNVIGALIGAVGINAARKILPKFFKDDNLNSDVMGAFVSKGDKAEKRGIYNVTFNGKNSSEVKKYDLEALNDFIKYERGFESNNKGKGALHIQKHLGDGTVGELTTDELLSLGDVIRNGNLSLENGRNVYRLTKEDGTILTAVTGANNNSKEKIITYYSNRNLGKGVHTSGTITSTSPDDKILTNTTNKVNSNVENLLKNKGIKLNASPTATGGMVGGLTGATSDLDGDDKITYKDILYGALSGAGLTKGALMAKDTHFANKAINTIKKASDTDFADAIVGHKIYEKKDYMSMREDMLKAKNQKLDDFSNLHEQLKLLDEPTRKDMYKYMSGDKSVNLQGNIKNLADNYINEIDRLSKEMVDLGILDEAQFDKYKGKYLHRRYEKDLSQKFNSLFTKGKTVSGVFARGKEWTGTKTEYDKLLNDGKIGDFFSGKIEATRMQNGQYKFRQDWTDEQRARWGEIDDIAFSLPETLMRSTEMVQHGKMLKNIVDKTNYISNEALDGYTQLNGKKFGALNGKYVPKDIASDINDFHNAIFGYEDGLLSKEAMEVFKALSTFWKKSHTVYNPIAHMNNLLSNITMQFGAGINPTIAVKNAYKGAITSAKIGKLRELEAKKLIGLSNEEKIALDGLLQDDDLKLWNEAQRSGLFGRSNLNDILNQYVNPTKTNSLNLTGTKKILNKVNDVASRMYQGEDDIMRFSMLKSLTQKGTKFDEALKIVNSTIPDYTKPMSRLARFGRNSMLTPFISWTYYSTPIILKQFKEHPERILAIYGSLYGLNKLVGIDPFDEKDIPQKNFAMKRIPIYKDGKEITTLKMDRWIPHNDILNPLDMVKNITNGGAWRAIPDILNNSNSYYGGKITYNDGALKAYDLGKYGVQQITPDILDNILNLAESKMMSKEKRTKNPVIQPRTTTQELLKFLGLNVLTYNKSNQTKKVMNEKIK